MTSSPIEEGEITDELIQESFFSLEKNFHDNYEHVNMDIESDSGYFYFFKNIMLYVFLEGLLSERNRKDLDYADMLRQLLLSEVFFLYMKCFNVFLYLR